MQLFVGSTNPVKVNAVRQAIGDQWSDVPVQGFSVASDVSEQPYGDEETEQGAVNRAYAALERGREELSEDEEALGIGLEGGVIERGEQLWSTVWVAVTDGSDEVFLANGARFPLHPLIGEPIKQGREMGPLMEELVQEDDIRKKQGMIGIITKNFVTRTEEYVGITKMAIGQWYGRDWPTDLK